jgi:hypothetical protein
MVEEIRKKLTITNTGQERGIMTEDYLSNERGLLCEVRWKLRLYRVRLCGHRSEIQRA